MKLIICKNYDEMSKIGANIIISEMMKKDNFKIGLATGTTPEKMYEYLIKAYNNNLISFEKVLSVNLDEYVNIDYEDENSYHKFMYSKLFEHVDIKKDNIFIPSPDNDNLAESVEEYDKILDKIGRRDLQVLGIGGNGHIAFNEPSNKLNLRTSIIDLKNETIEANSRFFKSKEEVPVKAMSMGIGDIVNAETILIMASGKEKHNAVKKLIETDFIDLNFPASILKLKDNVILIVDEKAYKG